MLSLREISTWEIPTILNTPPNFLLQNHLTMEIFIRVLLLVVVFVCGKADGHNAHGKSGISLSATNVIEYTYARNAAYIRQGLPSHLVAAMYKSALMDLATEQCIHNGEIKLKCFEKMFSKDHSNATRDIIKELELDQARKPNDRYFPNFISLNEVPGHLDTLEKTSMVTEMKDTSTIFIDVVHKVYKNGELDSMYSNLIRFPSDEVLRFDPSQSVACREFQTFLTNTSLLLSASALTAYVVGIVEQIILAQMDRSAAKILLDQHVSLVYTAARCTRLKGELLIIPTTYLDRTIEMAHIVVLKSKIELASTILSSLPKLTDVLGLIRGSKRLFGDIIDQLDGLRSLGRSAYLFWENGTVKSLNLHEILGNETTIPTFSHYYHQDEMEKPKECKEAFKLIKRLDSTNDDDERCCLKRCIQSSGNVIDLAISNEMCCRACNQLMCDDAGLKHVISVQKQRALETASLLGDII